MSIDDLPLGANPRALRFPHFPSPFHAVVFRNWGQISAARLARVLATDEARVLAEAARMGLDAGASPEREAVWLRRGYLTLIRQNWHLLPYAQLLDLLGWTPRQMAHMLKEEDFLWNKLGNLKPACEPVGFEPLDAGQVGATELIRQTVAPLLDELGRLPAAEAPFAFLEPYRTAQEAGCAAKPGAAPRIAYSFFAVYGDPLLDPELNPYPDGLLERYAACGVNGVWLQGVLYTLVPWLGPTPYSEGHEIRITNLNRLIERAAKFGIGVYLYLNEPRYMPGDFFEQRPGWRGAARPGPAGTMHCLCLSCPEVLERFETGARELAGKVPGLAGAFTITMSENPTHCRSAPYDAACPRCAGRQPFELVVEANNAMARGLFAANPNLRLAAWDWSWDPEWPPSFIAGLDPRIALLCTSETHVSTKAGGIDGMVGDYSISQPGPGPLARAHWAEARKTGREIWAKVQVNTTWECSGVPFLPVPPLVAEHLDGVRAEGVTGFLASWTLGGFPGGNMELFERAPAELAAEKFGQDAAPGVIAAWCELSAAFREFPLHGCFTLYTAPQNYGPMNLLFATPSGYRATMVGFPYDDLEHWRAPRHPEAVFEDQFRKLTEGWRRGTEMLEALRGRIPPAGRREFEQWLRMAQAAYCCFRSTYLQTRFVRLRGDRSAAARREVAAVLNEEIRLAREFLSLQAADSKLGFEASNHYYCTRNNLLEKILNCRNLLQAYPA